MPFIFSDIIIHLYFVMEKYMRRKNTTHEMMMGYMATALLELMLEKDYTKISIGEIAKKAGVDRSSYYRHFKSKEDIISFFFDMVLKESLDGYTNLSSIDFTLYIPVSYTHLNIHSIYTAFFNYKNEILLIHYANLSFLLLDVLSKRFQFSELATQFPLTKQYELSYIIGGIYNNLIFWMSRDMKETPDELTEISLQFRNEDSLSLLSLR